jgi:hypothetical protein
MFIYRMTGEMIEDCVAHGFSADRKRAYAGFERGRGAGAYCLHEDHVFRCAGTFVRDEDIDRWLDGEDVELYT